MLQQSQGYKPQPRSYAPPVAQMVNGQPVAMYRGIFWKIKDMSLCHSLSINGPYKLERDWTLFTRTGLVDLLRCLNASLDACALICSMRDVHFGELPTSPQRLSCGHLAAYTAKGLATCPKCGPIKPNMQCKANK